MTARRTYHRLRDLMDVLVSSPADGEVLTYSSAAGKWENQAGGGGGGSLPVPSLQDFNSSPVTTVTNGGNANLEWYTAGLIGDDLVDLSDTTRPAVRTAGIYAVSVNVTALSDMSVGGYFDFYIQLDANNIDLSVQQDSRTATAAQKRPQSAQTVVGYIPVNELIIVTMHNRDGAASVDFVMSSAFIQRLT